MIKDFKFNKINLLIIAIITIGIVLRIMLFSYNRPLWNDECALALNLIDFKIPHYFQTLTYGQAAPPFFLIISKIFSKLSLNIELSLRIFPLISSIFSIGIFYLLSKKLLTKQSSIIFALILFCFNPKLIYFGQEFKQYSSDVLFFICILTSYFYLDINKLSFKKTFLIGTIYSFCIWFSFTSLSALFIIFILLTIKNYKKLSCLISPVLISLILFYFSQNHLQSNNFLHTYWAEGFIQNNFSNLLQIMINYFVFTFNNLFLFFLFIVGLLISIINLKKEKNVILIAPLFLAIILSYFSIYPLSSRVSLYLIPIIILLIAQVFDYINLKNVKVNSILCLILMFLCSITSILVSINTVLFKNFEYEDILTPLNIAKTQIKPQNVLYISDGSKISYIFYKNKFNFKSVIIENKRINNFNEYEKELNKLPKNKTYYYIYCHFPHKKQRLQELYLWGKTKKDFKIYTDKSLNALLIFSQ